MASAVHAGSGLKAVAAIWRHDVMTAGAMAERAASFANLVLNRADDKAA